MGDIKSYYDIQEFYLMLKLGLFNGGRVGNWGYVSCGNINTCFLKKPLIEYQNQHFCRIQLAIGMYLSGMYLLENKNKTTYILIISVCRAILGDKEKIYVLKLVSTHAPADLKDAVITGSLSRKRQSVYRRALRKAAFDGSPLNSLQRKH
jgi:hypothetical protein